MSKEKISIKFLIHLVGERPALWDKTSEAYKDRALKDTSWREICTFINENYEHMQTAAKQEFTKMVTKKWTHIRDSWVKSMKYGYDAKTILPAKPYVYHNELKFLQKILKCKRHRYDLTVSGFERYLEGNKDTSSQLKTDHDEDQVLLDFTAEDTMVGNENNESLFAANNKVEGKEYDDDDDNEDEWPLESTPTIEIKQQPNLELRSSEIKTQLPKTSLKRFRFTHGNTRQSDGGQTMTDNRHWNFFKGIFPSVNMLDEDHSLEFQAGVITLLQKLRTSQKQSQERHVPRKERRAYRKTSSDLEYEYPIHKVDLSRRYATRSLTNIEDPISGDKDDSENNSDC